MHVRVVKWKRIVNMSFYRVGEYNDLILGIETWFPEIPHTVMRHEMSSLNTSPSGSEPLLVQSSGKEYSLIRVGIQILLLGQANQNFYTFVNTRIWLLTMKLEHLPKLRSFSLRQFRQNAVHRLANFERHAKPSRTQLLGPGP
ncbi:hypothetical protein PILCRDRAFT_582509 [Piloderma croceum F 1598]|uniref:Uncharacterized protein n=1 Tax=Piloderma croceum (strain F 1598) TaxID=765440 RepID=A0A0C3BN34_PILCF|nr:hypothetical protein PILCRDRAFT_582509 [Piloderma croceum F 1598]